jgi:gliding motility associated protien GldN
MKKILGISSRVWCTLLLGVATVGMAEAQSSVRRVPRKDNASTAQTSTSKPTSTKSTAKAADKKTTTPAAPAATPAKSTSPAGDGSAPVKRTAASKKPTGTTTTATGDQVTLRAQAFDEYQKRDESDATWQRTVYRELDLTQGSNASLYYPEEPTDGLTNFFRVILDLVVSGQVKAYEYLDGREVFSDKYVIKVEDMLSKFQIYYTTKPASGRAAATLSVDENDVPCNEVLSYFVKERWEFDRTTSQYGPRVLAVCPVLHRAGDFGGEAFKYPMFWLNYEDLRPYLRKQLIVSDGMNAAPRYTMEDFFSLAQYQGEIYKVQNLRGLSLMQQYPDADTLRMKRAEIDRDLHRFQDSIWVSEPAPEEVASKKASASSRTTASSRTSGETQSGTSGTKINRRTKETVDVAAAEAEREAQAEALDAQAERTGAARSVRRTRR